jgi:hypothetical protein
MGAEEVISRLSNPDACAFQQDPPVAHLRSKLGLDHITTQSFPTEKQEPLF